MNLSELRAVLERTPLVLAQQLDGLPEAWASTDAGGSSWSVRDVLAHLVQGEVEDWVPRARILLKHGTARTFEPFDPEGFRAKAAGTQLPELLSSFAELRRENLAWLEREGFTESQLALRGTHPEFGSITLRQLLWTWAAHDLSHSAQMARVLARQVREDVGPWREYLPFLSR